MRLFGKERTFYERVLLDFSDRIETIYVIAAVVISFIPFVISTILQYEELEAHIFVGRMFLTVAIGNILVSSIFLYILTKSVEVQKKIATGSLFKTALAMLLISFLAFAFSLGSLSNGGVQVFSQNCTKVGAVCSRAGFTTAIDLALSGSTLDVMEHFSIRTSSLDLNANNLPIMIYSFVYRTYWSVFLLGALILWLRADLYMYRSMRE